MRIKKKNKDVIRYEFKSTEKNGIGNIKMWG